MRQKTGTVFMIAGAALILAALSLFLWNRREARQAGLAAERVLSRIREEIGEAAAAGTDGRGDPDPDSREMTVVEIDGYEYIGYLSIPILGLELPVMSDWSYPQLKLSPCRYDGSTKTDDLVIAAHNYAEYFGTIQNLSAGDTVYFIDMDGIVSGYEVAEIEILSPYAVAEMTAGGWDLTLFTCTYSTKYRVTVRCDRLVEESGIQ